MKGASQVAGRVGVSTIGDMKMIARATVAPISCRSIRFARSRERRREESIRITNDHADGETAIARAKNAASGVRAKPRSRKASSRRGGWE